MSLIKGISLQIAPQVEPIRSIILALQITIRKELLLMFPIRGERIPIISPEGLFKTISRLNRMKIGSSLHSKGVLTRIRIIEADLVTIEVHQAITGRLQVITAQNLVIIDQLLATILLSPAIVLLKVQVDQEEVEVQVLVQREEEDNFISTHYEKTIFCPIHYRIN